MSSNSSDKTRSSDRQSAGTTVTTVGQRSEPDDVDEDEVPNIDASIQSLAVRPDDVQEEEQDEARTIASEGAEPPSTARSIADTMVGETEEAEVTGDEDPLAAKKLAYAQRKQKKAREEEEARKLSRALGLQHLLEEEEEEEEDEVASLLERHDSELTAKQIVEKDIMMYDLLLSNEELMDMKDSGMSIPEQHAAFEEEEMVEEELQETPTDEASDMDEEEEEEATDEVTAAPEAVDLDDPDNIVNMMMQAQEMEDDELKLLFKQDLGAEQDTDTLLSQDGIVGITLSDETKQFLELEQDLMDWPQKWAWISYKRVKMHIYIYQDKSEFHPFYDQLKNYPDFALLLGIDVSQQSGQSFFLCLTPEARNFVLNPPRKRKIFVDMKKKEEEAWDKLASITPKKWRSLGSDVEVNQENIQNSRPLLTVYAYRYAEHFGADTKFGEAKWPAGSDNICTGFEAKTADVYPGVSRQEIDRGIQVNPPKKSTECQTGFSFKRNKMCQQEVQEIDPQIAEENLKSAEMDTFFHRSRPFVEKVLQQNEMLNIMADDYHNLKAAKGHEVEFNDESVLLQEYQTYADARHSKGRCVTHMMFHPLLDEVVIMAFTEDVTFDKRIEFHSKVLMDPNFVLMWDLKEPSKPQLMFDAPSDVFSFMVSPSDPNLICGGCENGQVVLWDCGRHYIELRNRIQERKRKDSEGLTKPQGFLEKLKDSAEKYVCPLIPPAGLSNLDSSHKRVVTTVHWLPPHVELAKNGNLYDNSWGGRSAQFFSVAGDNTVRLWDIRVQKLGLDEFDVAPVSTIKVNPWHHLDNNQWKFSTKYTLDDGNGTMFCTLMTLSEGKIGDILVAESVGSQSSLHTIQSLDTVGMRSGSSSVMGSATKVRSSRGGGNQNASHHHHHHKASIGSGVSADRRTSDVMSVDRSGGSIEAKGSGANSQGGGDTDLDSINAAAKRAVGVLNNNSAQTSFFAGTETGQVALIDWLRNKDGTINADAAGNKICQNIYLQKIHNGSITSISRSPFHHELILVVGGGTVSIWKERSGYPVLATLGGETFAWCGCWSTTRPGVFFCGTREGSLQVWDLMDKSHAPVLVQQVSPGRICSIAVPKSLTQKKHFLAIGDSLGTLIVMVIPRYYTKPQPGENGTIVELMNREETRMANWITNTEDREEQIKIINQEWKDKRVSKTEKEITEEELKAEARLNGEYQEFLEFQSKLVSKLKREEPQLPTEDLDLDAELEALIIAAEEKEAERLKKAVEMMEEEE